MARVKRTSRTGTNRLNTIAALRDCLVDLGWATQYDAIATSAGFSAMSVGEGTSPDCSPCCLLFSMGYPTYPSYLRINLCTWVSTTALSGAGQINYNVSVFTDTDNLRFLVDDVGHTVSVTGNKDMLLIELMPISGAAQRVLIFRLNENLSQTGIASSPVVAGTPIQLRTGDAARFMAGGVYCAVSHPRGGVREGYYQKFTVSAIDTVNDTIATTLSANMGAGSALGGNPFPWVGIPVNGPSNQTIRCYTLPADNYTTSGSIANITNTMEWNNYLKPSSIRQFTSVPLSTAAMDAMAHGRRMIYPVYFGDMAATYGSSDYVKLPLFGSAGDTFGVNDHGTCTVASSTGETVTASLAAWAVDEHKGRTVFFNSGTVIGARALVISNTANTLTLDVALSPLPATGDSFTLFDGFYVIVAPTTPSSYFSYFPALAIKAV